MGFLNNPSQLNTENENPSNFPAHPQLQKVMGFSKTHGIVMGFLKPIAFLGPAELPDCDGFLSKTTQPNGFGHQKCDGFFKKPVAV